ncbi:MAG: mannonate dehydratase [Rhodothermaceae bacterium]|nr:MAG: mannonate dehydratase [Rhodothermaceae bacterium]
MLPSWRWFGPDDPVTLADARQAGAVGIVSALHEIPAGAVWPVEAIRARRRQIEEGPGDAPLRWVVVESVPVHEAIKTGGPDRDRYIDNYRQTLRNLAACGPRIVCYNFMPVLDWTRTDLAFPLPTGALALRFDRVALAAFDLFILRRPGAARDYDEPLRQAARDHFEALTGVGRERLARTILAGLPGGHAAYDLEAFRAALAAYREVGERELRANLAYFLRAVADVAEEVGVHLAIHPDDPPYPLLGLPRVVSTEADLAAVLQAADTTANGLTFCTGSLGVRPENDLPGMVHRFGRRIHFVHLRNIRREPGGSFHESEHLAGAVDMYAVVRALIEEERRRVRDGTPGVPLPMRPDHGHRLLDDLRKPANPGYPAIGRLRGLAELRGLEHGIGGGAREPTA